MLKNKKPRISKTRSSELNLKKKGFPPSSTSSPHLDTFGSYRLQRSSATVKFKKPQLRSKTLRNINKKTKHPKNCISPTRDKSSKKQKSSQASKTHKSTHHDYLYSYLKEQYNQLKQQHSQLQQRKDIVKRTEEKLESLYSKEGAIDHVEAAMIKFKRIIESLLI